MNTQKKMNHKGKLQEFFFFSLESSIKEQNISLSDGVKFYLMNLLSLKGNNLSDKKVSIADLYLNALNEARKANRINLLKEVGDLSIIKTGAFPGSGSRIMKSKYYRDMGIMGYGETYLYTQNDIYYDLSINYDLCIDAIHGVMIMSIKDDILGLHRFWEKTKSRAAKNRLGKLGFLEMKGVSA